MLSARETFRRCAMALAVWLASPLLCAAQQSTAFRSPSVCAAGSTCKQHDETGTGAGSAQPDQANRDAAEPEYPSLNLSGFSDFAFAAQNKSGGTRGFSEGQFVLHFTSALSPRVNFFGELSLTARADAGTDTPPATGFNAEVERAIIRFDRNDQLKVSFGRYHTPINWWNTAFHHGQWLQTTISRPEMIQFGARFIPVHFVGALAEGAFPAGGWNLNYKVGIGNGRGSVISRAGDAGDNNASPASVVNLFTKPDRAFGLQVGGSLYLDKITLANGREFRERIVAAHAIWEKEDPEVIAEIASVRHRDLGDALTNSSVAYYIQTAYRLPWFDRLWKPYYRFEHIDIAGMDPVFQGVPNLNGSTLGVRYDISTLAALKTEARVRRRASNRPRANGWFLQVSFTF
jgi:hypothetical protein